jgi:hypothetical protein
LPEITDHRSGVVLSKPIEPNAAADVDLIASYQRPYWPHAADSLRDNSRLAPLRNDAGMWLTATSYKRSQTATPTPPALVLPMPKPDAEPARIMCAGPGGEDGAGLYWFVEATTSRQLLEASRPTAPAQRQFPIGSEPAGPPEPGPVS